jgi:hypothetical protein
MPIQNFIPTNHQTPDAGQGGFAADASNNTSGSGGSNVFGDGIIGGSEMKSCRWFGFQSPIPANAITSTLKVTYSGGGSMSGGLTNNNFRLQYSLNGGSNWITIVEQSDFNGVIGPTTFSLGLSLAQDLTQIQIRVRESAFAFNVGDLASAGFNISDIKIEVQTPQSMTHMPCMM